MTTTTTMTMASQKVTSWIDDEHRCVTTQRISQSLNLSRKSAAQVLEGLYDSEKHQAVVCHMEETEKDGVPVTIFRLHKSTGDTKHIVALASLQATESIATAHERDLLEWREMVAEGCGTQQLAIVPADATTCFLDASASLENTIKPVDSNTTTIVAPMTSSFNRHKAFSNKTAKVTTAASFFGKKAPASASAPANPSTTNATNNVTTAKAGTTASSQEQPPKPTSVKESKARIKQVAPAPSKSAVGNVDDIVWDDEDSEDEQEQVRQQNKAARRKAVQKANLEEATILDKEPDDEEHEEFKVVGAMDAFATAPKPQPKPTASTRQRKRRKKLVEETVMVNGYLRTETKAIWEDVPTDEEEEEKKQQEQKLTQKKNQPHQTKTGTKNQPVKSQQGMKQKSLMGFFNKK